MSDPGGENFNTQLMSIAGKGGMLFTHILVLTQIGSAVRAHVLDNRGVYALRQLQDGIPEGRRENRLSLCVYGHGCIIAFHSCTAPPTHPKAHYARVATRILKVGYEYPEFKFTDYDPRLHILMKRWLKK